MGLPGARLTVKVILDTNFLFIPSQFQIDIFEELENLLNQKVQPIVLSSTYEELKKLVESAPPKIRRQASLALDLARRCEIVDVERLPNETNDDVIVRVAKVFGCPVATNDRTLKRRLRNMKVAVIYLRQKSRLDMEGAPSNV